MADYFLELFRYDFMKRAFIAILIIAPLLGLLGTMIIQKKMAFFSEAIGHSALTGIAFGVILSFTDMNLPMVVFACVFALVLNYLGSKNLTSTDTLISVCSSVSSAIGLAILSFGGSFSKYSSLLIGDILSISSREIIYLLVIFVVTIAFYVLCINKLAAVSLSKDLAKSSGIPVKLIDNIFSIIIALIVTLSIKWVGILLINALLILPAASSRNIAINMRQYMLYSLVFSLFSGIIGLVVSYFFNIATGPVIVIVAAFIYFATYIMGKE